MLIWVLDSIQFISTQLFPAFSLTWVLGNVGEILQPFLMEQEIIFTFTWNALQLLILPDFLFLCFWKGALTDDRCLSIGGVPCFLSLEISWGVFVCVSVERYRNLLFTCEVKHFHHFCFCFLNCMCISVSISFLGLQIRGNMNWYRQTRWSLFAFPFLQLQIKTWKTFWLKHFVGVNLFFQVISHRTRGNGLRLSKGRFGLDIGKISLPKGLSKSQLSLEVFKTHADVVFRKVI